MYASRATQLIVGLFALLGLIAMAFLSFRLGKVEIFNPPSYVIYANFDNVSGIKAGDSVEIAGVSVGRVENISLKNERARVMMRIDRGVKIDDEAIAAIRTRGIIGDKYVAISPGPSDKFVSNGSVLRQTESAFVLEDAIGQLINNAGTGGKSKGAEKGGSDGSNNFPRITDPSSSPNPSPSPNK